MKAPLNWLLALLLAAWLAMPSRGDAGGGDNAGGTGVWILPFCANVGSGGGVEQPRLSIQLGDLSRDVTLECAPEIGAAVATCIDELSGQPVFLSVVGRRVTLPSATLRVLSQARVEADIVIADGQQRGYRIHVDVSENDGSLTLRIF
jgi:hypothetical protein